MIGGLVTPVAEQFNIHLEELQVATGLQSPDQSIIFSMGHGALEQEQGDPELKRVFKFRDSANYLSASEPDTFNPLEEECLLIWLLLPSAQPPVPRQRHNAPLAPIAAAAISTFGPILLSSSSIQQLLVHVQKEQRRQATILCEILGNQTQILANQ